MSASVRIEYDPEPSYANPRDNTNLSELALYHRRYNLPNDSLLRLTDYGEFQDLIDAVASVGGRNIVPVWMLDHSGTTVAAGHANPFADPWDSRIVGVAYTTAERIAEVGTPEDKIDEVIKAEVDEYGTWMRGEVYTVSIVDGDEVLESVGGIVGHSWAVQEAAELLEYHTKEAS